MGLVGSKRVSCLQLVCYNSEKPDCKPIKESYKKLFVSPNHYSLHAVLAFKGTKCIEKFKADRHTGRLKLKQGMASAFFRKLHSVS